MASESLVFRFGCQPVVSFLLGIISVHANHQIIVILLLFVLPQVAMQTLGLISPLLSALGLGVKLFFLATRLEVHPQIIKLLGSREVLRFFFVLLKKFVRPILSTHEIFLFLELRLLLLDCAAEVLFMLFLRIYPDIVVLQIYERSLFISGKEMILSVIVGSFERLN